MTNKTRPAENPPPLRSVKSSSTIAMAWAGHPVGFDLLVHDGRHYAAFYDGQRRLTVASRRAGDDAWELARPPGAWRGGARFAAKYAGAEPYSNILPWDSHNYLTLAVDADGYLHLSGNMHCDPLVYYRGTRPHDIHRLERIDRMTGLEEDRCTYPRFIHGGGELFFRYRQGRSGDGADYYNAYDRGSRTWRRLLARPLLDGRGRMNAYATLPEKGPDGLFHLVWVWRNTPDCATNHHLSYLRSADLVHWTNVAGEPQALPVVLESDVVVDPAPPGGGMLNGKQWLGFDHARRPVISYTRYDEAGLTQAYCARFENGAWRIRQISNWDYRWEFGGRGCIENGSEIQLAAVAAAEDRSLRLSFCHVRAGAGTWRLDPDSLAVIETLPRPPGWPPELTRAETDYPGLQARLLPGREQNRPGPSEYALRWETLGPNRDRPRRLWPPPGPLRCYHLETAAEQS